MTLTLASCYINILIGLCKLVLGVWYGSQWFLVTGGYYIVLSITRGQLLHHAGNIDQLQNVQLRYRKQQRTYRRTGYFVMLLALAYLALCVHMYFYEEAIYYPGYIIFGIAAIAFYKIGISICGLCAVKKQHNPVLSAIKIISLFDACVSIVAIQCALLTMQQSTSASISSAYLGMAISGVFLVLGSRMIHRKKTADVSVCGR